MSNIVTDQDAPITKDTFWARAARHAKAKYGTEGWPTISPLLPQWQSWVEYFDRHLGWGGYGIPIAMLRVLDGTSKDGKFTVPEDWPHTFDPNFHSQPGWVSRRVGDEARDKRAAAIAREVDRVQEQLRLEELNRDL